MPVQFQRVPGTCYNRRIHLREALPYCRSLNMRTPMVTVFHETLNYCFDSALEGMGKTVRDVIYDFLGKKGITRAEVSNRFDDVAKVLTETFGSSARIIIYKTVVELHKEYSMRTDFTYQDSLRDHISLLKDRVVADHLYPRRSQRTDPFLEKPSATPLIQPSGQSPVRT